MTEEGKNNGSIEPAHEDGLKPGAAHYDASVSGNWIIDTDTGEAAPNPLAISDPKRRDDAAIYTRKATIWAINIAFLAMLCFTAYGQLICTPPRAFDAPEWIIAMVAGAYFGLSVSILNKLMELVAEWRNKRK